MPLFRFWMKIFCMRISKASVCVRIQALGLSLPAKSAKIFTVVSWASRSPPEESSGQGRESHILICCSRDFFWRMDLWGQSWLPDGRELRWRCLVFGTAWVLQRDRLKGFIKKGPVEFIQYAFQRAINCESGTLVFVRQVKWFRWCYYTWIYARSLLLFYGKDAECFQYFVVRSVQSFMKAAGWCLNLKCRCLLTDVCFSQFLYSEASFFFI